MDIDRRRHLHAGAGRFRGQIVVFGHQQAAEKTEYPEVKEAVRGDPPVCRNRPLGPKFCSSIVGTAFTIGVLERGKH